MLSPESKDTFEPLNSTPHASHTPTITGDETGKQFSFSKWFGRNLGYVQHPAHAAVIWKIVEAGIVPRYNSLGPSLSSGPDPVRLFDSRENRKNSATQVKKPSTPTERSPQMGGKLPSGRAHRKRCQIEAIAQLLAGLVGRPGREPLSTDGAPTIVVDFCGGSGHTSLVLAAAWTAVTFVVLDFNDHALKICAARAKELGLHNVETLCLDVAQFPPPHWAGCDGRGGFSVGIALHACGAATDMALAACAKARAKFIVSPCCVGKVGKCTGKEMQGVGQSQSATVAATKQEIQFPRSRLFREQGSVSREEYVLLAGAADYHSCSAPAPTRRAAKSLVELDRATAMAELGYRVCLGKLPPTARSPKDDLIWGWIPGAGFTTGIVPQSWDSLEATLGRDFESCGYWALPPAQASNLAPLDWQAACLVLPDASTKAIKACTAVLSAVHEMPGAEVRAVQKPGVKKLNSCQQRKQALLAARAANPSKRKAKREARRAGVKTVPAKCSRTTEPPPLPVASGAQTSPSPEPKGTCDPTPVHVIHVDDFNTSTRRSLHILAHAMLTQHKTEDRDIAGKSPKCWKGSAQQRGVLLQLPSTWPFVFYETEFAIAGPLVERTVRAALAK